MADLLSSVVEAPTEAQKAVFIQKVKDLEIQAETIFTSQSGLENAFTDEAKKALPENREFYQLVSGFKFLSKAAQVYPERVYSLLTANADVASSRMARFAVVIEEFKKRYRTRKSKPF
jgi:hypothetical protein